MPAARQTGQYKPQLARLVATPPSGSEWLHELKYDGYRIGCRIVDGAVHLLSRNGNDWTDRFAVVAAAAARLPVRSALLDGEVAAVLPSGRTSFQALQNASAGAAEHELVYFLFDLLHLDGEDLTGLALVERKQRLSRLLRRAPRVLRYSTHVLGDGVPVLAEACRLGAEGIVSKRADRPYEAGRGPDWVKSKCIARQEVVIGGFTEPQGRRSGIGALLLGAYDAAGSLSYAGKVGTGFTERVATDLRRRLTPLERPQSPFATPPPAAVRRGAHWVEPRLVAEVAFSEWTADGRMRHPSFQGLREDKAAADVRRELPVDSASPAAAHPSPPATRRHESRKATRQRAAAATVAGVTISHPDRVVWTDAKISKLDLARYYEAVAEWILPHLADRPLTLVRCPGGVEDGCFFMKHASTWSAPGLERVDIREKHKIGQYLVAKSAAGLVALAQMNVIELHTWNSTTRDLERPDRVVIDLDPGPDVQWAQVVEGARLVHAALDALQLSSFVKTTGGRGVHIVVPLRPRAGWEACLTFAHRLAEVVAATDPQRFTTNFTKRGRERQILIDYKRNNRTNTSVAAYSARARPGAPVSMPVAWAELRTASAAPVHTIRTALPRLRRLRSDPWAGYGDAGRHNRIEDALEKLDAAT